MPVWHIVNRFSYFCRHTLHQISNKRINQCNTQFVKFCTLELFSLSITKHLLHSTPQSDNQPNLARMPSFLPQATVAKIWSTAHCIVRTSIFSKMQWRVPYTKHFQHKSTAQILTSTGVSGYKTFLSFLQYPTQTTNKSDTSKLISWTTKMTRDSRKSRKHGNCDFRQMPWFCQNAVFFCQNAVVLHFLSFIIHSYILYHYTFFIIYDHIPTAIRGSQSLDSFKRHSLLCLTIDSPLSDSPAPLINFF